MNNNHRLCWLGTLACLPWSTRPVSWALAVIWLLVPARLEVLCAVVEFCAPPFVGPLENGSKRQTLLTLAPETPNTTLYSESFDSEVDELRDVWTAGHMNIDNLNAYCGHVHVACPCLGQGQLNIHQNACSFCIGLSRVSNGEAGSLKLTCSVEWLLGRKKLGSDKADKPSS